MTYFPTVRALLADSPGLDAFGRLRISNPNAVFDAQLTYDLRPLIFEQIVSGSGASIAHDSTNRMALMTFSSTPTGGKAYMQSYEHIRYEPGRSHQIYLSFNFIAPVTDVLKFAGLSVGNNGIEFQLSGATRQFVLYSDTGNGDQTVVQSNWNLDKLDGTGLSGLTLDTSKVQILVIDLQALYSGRVRVGFDIGGRVVYAHEFLAANLITTPYIQTANLPIRCGMTCTGTVSATINFICCTAMSEGGNENLKGAGFSAEGTVTAGNGTRTHLLSVRPKTTFNSIVNRIQFLLDTVDILVTGANPILFEVCIGQAISGTTAFNDVNATYSGFEYNTLGTISGNPALVILAFYAASGSSFKGYLTHELNQLYPVTLDAAGAVRALGTLSLIATAFTGTSPCHASFNWREVR